MSTPVAVVSPAPPPAHPPPFRTFDLSTESGCGAIFGFRLRLTGASRRVALALKNGGVARLCRADLKRPWRAVARIFARRSWPVRRSAAGSHAVVPFPGPRAALRDYSSAHDRARRRVVVVVGGGGGGGGHGQRRKNAEPTGKKIRNRNKNKNQKTKSEEMRGPSAQRTNHNVATL